VRRHHDGAGDDLSVRRSALVATGLVALAAPAAQAAEWTPTVPVSGDRSVLGAAAGADARGGLVVVWQHDTKRAQRPPDGGFGGTESIVRARALGAGGAHAPVQALSVRGEQTAGPVVAVNRRGDAVAVWTQAYGGRRYTILAASRRHGGRFGRPQALGRSDRFPGAAPHVGLNNRGDAVVVWARAGRVQLASRRAGRRFAPAQTLAARRPVPGGVVVAPDGGALVAWTARGVVQVSERRAGRRFGEPRSLNPAGPGAASTTVAEGARGTVVVAWRTRASTVGVVRDAGATFGAPQTPDTFEPSSSFSGPGAAVTADGETLISWVRGAGASPVFYNAVVVASRPPGGTFGAPAVLSAVGLNADRPALAAERAGTVVASWSESGPAGPSARSRTVAAIRRRGAAAFGASERISGAIESFGPIAVVPSDTTTAILWRGGDHDPLFVARRSASVSRAAPTARSGSPPGR
jgi:hypothetical protein